MSIRVRWPIDIKDLFMISDLIEDGTNDKVSIAKLLGRGQEKVRCSLEWLGYLELIKADRKGFYRITSFNNYIKNMINDKYEDALALLYHKLYTNYEYIQWLIGTYGNEKFEQNETVQLINSKKLLIKQAHQYFENININVSEDTLTRQLARDLKSITSTEGFGTLGLVSYGVDKSIKFNSYQPSNNVIFNAILYNWPENTVAMSIDYFTFNKRSSLSQMFLLTPEEVLRCLKKLENLNLIDVINSGELSYIAKKSNITYEELLNNQILI